MEENGKKISQRTGGSLVDIAKSKGSQQTQSNSGLTAEQQDLKDWTKNKLQEQGILPGINQGTQTATTTTMLPGITKLQNLQESNKIQFGSNVKSNIILPGISEPKYPNATLSQATQETEKEGNKRAKDNVKDTRSMNEEIHDEMVKGEYIPLLKQGAKQTWNDIKKFGYRKGIEIVDDLANRPYETILGGIPHYKLLGKYLDNNITKNLDTKPLVDKSMNVLWNKYYKYEDKINKNFDKWVDQNMNKIIAKEYQDSGGVWESIKSGNTDMIKYGLMQGFSTSVIPMIPGIVAGVITKNPAVTASIAFASTAPIEDQEAYEEAMKEGATRDEATQIGRYAGIINGTLETIGEFLQLKGLLKPLKKNITKEITKKTTRQIISRGLLERNKGVFGEALTEGTQEFVTNALIKTINENKDIFEGVIDSMIVGGVLGGGGSTLGAGGKVIEDVENNKKIDLATDIEALNYVMQGEERKAQRMQQKQAEQREKIKQKILSRRKANTWGEVEEMDNKFQKTDEENAGFSSRNEYSEGRNIGWEKDENLSTNSMYVSDTTTSENSSHGDRMTTDSFFETDENGEYIEYDDGSRKERIYAGGNKNNKNGSIKSQFTEKSKGTPRTPKLKKYYNNFYRLVKNLSNPNVKVNDYVQIGKTGKGKNIYISKGVLAHIIEDHGVFDVNTLIESVNNPTGQKWESETTKTRQGGHGTRPYMEYDIGSEDSEIVVGIKPDSWEKDTDTAEYYGVVSMRESNAPTTPADNVKFQLKYEEKGYTPGVANKKEKNISGKEGIKQKNTINDETIEQLAEKYGVKVEVIKGMIEILKKGKREGYAYGKYRDQLLTLSEQIKESTAPHELLHAIFDMIDPETKTYLIAQVMKSEGWNAETAEERLADSFSNFFRTGKIEGAPKSTWGRIKIFFKRVRSFINGMNKWRNELDEIFTDIITADGIVDLQSKIDESSRLNKSKERMRKRFMEYRKNAQKIQSSKVPKDWSKKDASYQIADESVYELQPLERIEQMEKNILDEYGETDNPGRVAFIDNKGRWINGNMGGYGNYRDVDHREIAQTAFDDTDIEFNNGTDGLVALQAQTGLVRVNYNDGYMNIDTVYELMPSQREGLMKFADENIEEVNVDITDQKTGRTVKSDTFMNVRDAVRWIDRHFAESENKYQKAGDINSEAFKKRFGDSKVVDKDGNPLVVYHGTRYDIKIPNMKKGRRQAYGGGMYFTTNKQGAEHYANEKKNLLSFLRKPRVMEVYLSIQNPIKEGVYKWDNKWIDDLKKLGYEVNEEYLSRKNVDIFDKYFHLRMLQDKKKAINFTEDFSKVTGYDGLVAPQSGGEEYWVAFKPSQVKSATDNVGTYDANNDDIRYQKMDDEYAEAVENGNTARAKAILREYAKEKGYDSSTDYQGSLAFNGSAPSSDGLTKEERVSGNEDIYSQTLGDFASDGLDWWDLGRQLDPNGGLGIARSRASRGVAGGVYDLESINNLRNAVMEYKKGNKDVKIRMYRAIDSDIKEEKFRNGDWITPSKEYAKHHIDLQDWKKGRIISEDVSIEDIRWDGNDINERGFDNEKEYGYKDTPNNRKELEITYDDNGNLIPLSERFNENVEDERYQRVYHGSPYDFERFDSSHMGEGEGAQAHGWGHYVAVDENTGRRYAQLHQGDLYSNIKYKGESSRDMTRRGIDREDVNQVAPSDIMTSIVDGISRGKYDESMKVSDIAKDIINQRIEVYSNSYERSGDWIKNAETPEEKAEMQRRADRLRDLIKAYKDLDEKDFDRPQRNLYEVEIPDPVKADTPTGSNYLEENGEITKAQMDKIYDEVVKEYEKKKQGKAKRVQNLQDGKLNTFRNLIDEAPGMLSDGKGLYFTLSNVLGGPEQASKFLESLGYDGIHYFGGRDGEAYVIFNDDALEIKNHERYQKADSDQKDNDGRTLSNGQAEYFKDSKVRDDNGNLLRVYHGTKQPEEFTVFDNSKSNGYNSNSSAHIGNRFTDSKKGAENFAETTWAQGKPRAMEGYLNIKNPKIYETRDVTKEKAKAGENNKKLIKDMEDRLNVLGFNTKLGGYESLTGMPSLRYNDKEFMKMMGYLTSEAMVNDYKGWGGYSKLGDFVNALSKAGISDAQIVNEAKYLHNLYNDYMNSEKKYYSIQSDAYDQYQSDISTYGDNARDAVSEYKQDLIKQGYDGIIIKNTEYDGGEFGGTNTQYVSFNSNQFKNIDNLNPTDNEDIRYQKAGDINSPAFKKRFDGSKVVKENGKPQIVYHGTTAEFTVFNKIASRGIFGDGYYFTNRIWTARQYGYGRDGRVMKVYLAIKNPYVADNGDGYFLNTEKLKEEGYDGVQAIMGSETYWVAFDSNQIKSATDNVGTYDINNDDIRYQKMEDDGISALQKIARGAEYVKDAMSREDLKAYGGESGITFYWGNPGDQNKSYKGGYGISHIAEKHGAETLLKMISVLARGNIERYTKGNNTIAIGYNGYTAILALSKDNNKETRLLTGWKDNRKKTDGSSEVSTQSTPTQNSPTFSRTDLGAVLSQRSIIKNSENANENTEKFQITEYDYDENGNRKWIKFGDNSEFDPNVFGTPTNEEQIEEDKENEKSNPFYNAWMKYNNQNYKDDQLTLGEFVDAVGAWGERKQEEFDKRKKDIAEVENDPKMLELQLKAVKLVEEETNVGKKFGKNVSKEVRDRQQAEVETKREDLAKEIFEWMYPGLRFEEATYDDTNSAWNKEAEWEMLGREKIEEKLRYFKKDNNGNWEKKNIKLETPQEQREKIERSGNFDEVIAPSDRVIEWKTPEGQKGRLDKAKDPKQFKKVMEKINSGKSKTKVELKDVTNEVRALERYKENEKAEKERRKKEKQEEYAKKKQEEYKRNVRLKAFQRLVDMQRFEKYPFLSEDEIKQRWGFTDEEWKKITEQLDLGYPPKKRNEKAVSDFNKAVDSEVKFIIDGLSRQNKMKQKEAEKNLGEIGEIDLDVLLGKDEEKGQKEVEEFERIAKEEKKKEREKDKLEEGKTEFEKEMDRKTRKQKEQAEKLTKQWNNMFRKAEEKRNERYANKEEKKIDEVKSLEEAKAITKENWWTKTKKFWKDTTIQDLIQPISSRIEKISPRVYLEMMRFEQRIAIKQNTRIKQVEDFVKVMGEIRRKNKKDYLNITLHLLNGNVGTANKMLEKYNTSIPRKVLDEIWADAEDVGYTMNYEGFYYPRKVKDVKDFLNWFAKTEDKNVQGEIDKIIRKKEKQAQKRGEEFTPQQKADLINQLLMDGEVEGISLGSGHMKKRKVDSITKNMLEFYEDPVDALLQYISGMTEAIEKARFLGQGTKGEIKTLGEFIADEGISGYDADELRKLLLSRFNYAPMGEMMSKMKVSANIIHLGSPSSALSQLADISFSLIENGITNLVQGLSNKYNIDLDALGITNRGEELKAQGKNETGWEKVQRFTFKRTGFNMMDQFGKKSFVVSTLNKLIKYAKNDDPQLRKDLSRRFDDPKMINEIIEDLKEGRMSENVNLFLFTKLADVQPLTRTQMTRTYLQAGNWRVLYAFKTFGIKQLDYIIQKSKRELATKPTAKALWTITAMLGIIMLCGAGTDEIKDFSMGRKYNSWIWRMINGDDWSVSQLSDRFWDNFLKLLGFTKYSIYQARTQGVKSAVEDIFFSLPGLDLFTYPMQDIQDAMSEDGLDFSQASSWQLIPIVGKYGYWWAGAGQTKQQKSLDKEKNKNKKGSKKKGKVKL